MKVTYHVHITLTMVSIASKSMEGHEAHKMYTAPQADYMVSKSKNVSGWKDHMSRIDAAVTRHYQDMGGRAYEVKRVGSKGASCNRKGEVSDKQMGLL